MPLSIVYSSPSVQFTQYMELLWIQRFTQYFGLKLLDFFCCDARGFPQGMLMPSPRAAIKFANATSPGLTT